MAKKNRENSFLQAIQQIGIMRIFAVIAIILIGGWFAVALAISGISRIRNPQMALTFVSNESVALAGRADQLLVADPVSPPPAVARLARSALKQQAFNAKAMRLLGYAAETAGDRKRALPLIKMAARLSRREPGAQLWLIEYYVQANDTAKTLDHYDILLTTKPETQTLLFPRLSNAISDEPIRAALRPYLRKEKAWTSSYLWYAINNDKDLSNIVNLIIENAGFPKNKFGDISARQQERTLLTRLVAESRFAEAQKIYRLIPNAPQSLLTSAGFAEHDRDERFGAMGWQIGDNPDAGGGFAGKKGGGSPTLSIFANSATTSSVATKLLYLAPGSYRLSIKLTQYQPGDGGYVQFRMRCPTASEAAPLWTFNVEPKRNFGMFELPSNCPVQFLDIVASGGKGQNGLEAVIGKVEIAR